MKQFKAAIFDMDGLLIDSEKIAVKLFNETCDHFKLGNHHDVVISCIGTNATLSKEIIRKGLPEGTDIDLFHEHWHATYKHRLTTQPIPVKHGAQLLLEHLRSLGIPIAVATSTKTEMAKTKLSAIELIDYFDIIVGGDQVEHSKPRPEIYLRAASLLNVAATDCIAFEDSANGVKAGVAANMTVVQIPDLIAPTEELLALGHLVLGSLEEVISYKF
ncbi:HAD family hydrolase [Leucothrix arctica]|uniref:Phosphatase n=1 Tax=Leucothrix arctica TaxID=1481894 RepID=A0A317C6P0_9GAMM|nr:HAD family phosphatase [Leucothrix arctica]PWQ93977.1 phosphatase [Leucothrix arctica]